MHCRKRTRWNQLGTFLFAGMLLVAATAYAEPEEEDDPGFYKVGAEFDKLKGQDKLPGLGSKETGGEVAFFRVDPKEWKGFDLKPFDAAISGCRSAYLADVAIKEKRLRYFFCDSGQTHLTGAYELKGDAWTLISKPKG